MKKRTAKIIIAGLVLVAAAGIYGFAAKHQLMGLIFAMLSGMGIGAILELQRWTK